MPVIGAAIAIFMHGAAKLRQHDDNRIGPVVAEALREGGKALAERTQPIGELTLVIALADMGIPAAERGKGDPDAVIASHRRLSDSALAEVFPGLPPARSELGQIVTG